MAKFKVYKIQLVYVTRFSLFHLLWLTTFPWTLCQVPVQLQQASQIQEPIQSEFPPFSQGNDNNSSSSDSNPINLTIFERTVDSSSSNPNSDPSSSSSSGSRSLNNEGVNECFIQGPQGFRQSFPMSSSSSSSSRSSLSNPFQSNENLTVPVASVIEGLNEFGDSYFKLKLKEGSNDLDSAEFYRDDINFSPFFNDDDDNTNTNTSNSDSGSSSNSSDTNTDAENSILLYPCWLDRELAREGQAFARRNFAQIYDSHFLSLFLLIGNEQVRRVLAYTQKSNNPERAKRRYMATLLQVKLWYDEDLSSVHMAKSLLKVRNIHRTVGYRLDSEKPNLAKPQIPVHNDSNPIDTDDTVIVGSSNSNTGHGSESDSESAPVFKPKKLMWEAFRKDLTESYLNQTRGSVESGRKMGKYAYNQFLMSVTQWSFMALPIMYPHKFVGMGHVTEEELQGFTHLWAVLSYALGMKEEYILCKNKDLDSCRKYCKELYDKYFIPFLFTLDEEAEILLESLLKVPTFVVPQVTEEAILLHLLEDIVGIDCPNLREYSGWRTHLLRAKYKASEPYLGPSGFFSRFSNFLFRGQLQVAALKVYGFDGTNPAEVAERAYYF